MVNHPWFRPLWRRLMISGLCVAWAVAEALYGQPPWDWIVIALAVYAVWGFFVADTYRTAKRQDETSDGRE